MQGDSHWAPVGRGLTSRAGFDPSVPGSDPYHPVIPTNASLTGFSEYQGSCTWLVNTVFCTEINICGFILVPSLVFSIVPHFSALRNIKITRGRMFITYTNSWSSCPEFLKFRGSARISGYKSSQVSPGQAWLCLKDPVWELVLGASLYKCQGGLFCSILSYPHLRSSLFLPPGLEAL